MHKATAQKVTAHKTAAQQTTVQQTTVQQTTERPVTGRTVTGLAAAELARATSVAESVTDPEMPMLTLRDLGVLRSVSADGDRLVVTITPTYSGCPAMATMRNDLIYRLQQAGFDQVSVNTVLEPAWSSDWITDSGRQKLAENGISPPARVPRCRASGNGGPIPITLVRARRQMTCPLCGSANTELTSEFGSTACRALYRCVDCWEPFDHVKEI